MSWSIELCGKPSLVAVEATAKLGAIKCAEPEESIKAKVAEIIVLAMPSFGRLHGSDAAVRVSASGSQYTDSDGGHNAAVQLKIEPLYGFVG